MNYNNEHTGHDRLRGQFTTWLEKLIVRAKLDYIRSNRRYLDVISIEDLSDEAMAVCDDPIRIETHRFEFEDERMENAFCRLTPLRRQILTMLFVEEMTPEEVAAELGCSVDAVYNNRSRALKKLREAIMKGGGRKMKAEEFRTLLERATAGDKEAVEAILLLYMPLINRHCYISNALDEDMKQYVLLHIVKNLHKFQI